MMTQEKQSREKFAKSFLGALKEATPLIKGERQSKNNAWEVISKLEREAKKIDRQ